MERRRAFLAAMAGPSLLHGAPESTASTLLLPPPPPAALHPTSEAIMVSTTVCVLDKVKGHVYSAHAGVADYHTWHM